jgi:hypothetical protein
LTESFSSIFGTTRGTGIRLDVSDIWNTLGLATAPSSVTVIDSTHADIFQSLAAALSIHHLQHSQTVSWSIDNKSTNPHHHLRAYGHKPDDLRVCYMQAGLREYGSLITGQWTRPNDLMIIEDIVPCLVRNSVDDARRFLGKLQDSAKRSGISYVAQLNTMHFQRSELPERTFVITRQGNQVTLGDTRKGRTPTNVVGTFTYTDGKLIAS